jgi:anti-sigma B factor antagonist
MPSFQAWTAVETGKGEAVPHVPFEIESVHEGDSARLALSGELDLATVARVQDAVEVLLGHPLRRLTIDLSGLSFVDSSGLRLFIVLNRRAAAEGWKLTLTKPQQQAMTVFRISGAEENLPFLEDASRA